MMITNKKEEESQKEEKIEKEEKYEDKKPTKKKKSNTFILSIIVVMIIVAILVSLFIALNNVGLINFNVNNKNNNKLKLKYTETSKTNKSEGVYITDVSEVVENVMPSIVAITSKTLVNNGYFGPSFFSEGQYQEGAGSGIIISKNDNELLILTNNHVIEGAEALTVQFVNGKDVDATVKGSSDRRDVAVISVRLSDLDSETAEAIRIATMGDSSQLKVGNGIIAIGNALGYGQSVTTGVVSALNREVKIDGKATKMIQIDAAINGGNSGGALLNSSGEVVGINSAKYSTSGITDQATIEGMGFAIPISDVSELIENLMNGKEDKSDAQIGVEGYMINESQSKYNNSPIGFYISKVVEGSGADKAGLEMGNIITKINGNSVKEVSDITSIVDTAKKGDKVKLTIAYIKRNKYEEKEVEVTLS